jgi:hypothetical protein
MHDPHGTRQPTRCRDGSASARRPGIRQLFTDPHSPLI